MIGFYDYTVILTYMSLISAVSGIAFACGQRPLFAVFCLLLCGLFDMFDGKVARTKKNRSAEERSFGIQIDSLSDLVAFGVLPGVIAISLCGCAWYVCAAAAIYVLAALIRLAYFNVTEEIRQTGTDGQRKSYSGLPVTSAALIFPGFFCAVGIYCLCARDIQMLFQLFDVRLFSALLAILLAATALCFVLPFHVRKPRTKELWIFLLAGTFLAVTLLIVYILRGTVDWFGHGR